MNDTTNTPVRRRKSSGARKAIIAAVVVAIAGGGWYGWQKYKAGKAEEGGYLTAPIERGDIEDLVTSTGKLQPLLSVDVGAQVSGQIEKIYVEVGDVVQKGDVLAEIDATTAIAKVDQLKAQLLNAETNLKTQQTNLEKAERDTKRAIILYEADAATKEAKLNAETTLENAKRSIISSTAQLEVQRASLRIEERNLGYTKIIAPQAGTVMKVALKQGQTINATQNAPTVLTIADLTTMTVLAEVSEADVGKVFPGIPLYFTTLSGNNRRWYSELKRIEPMPKEQNSVVLYNALFEIQNEGDLRPSQTAQVYFVSAEAKNVLMLPMAAIQQGQQIQRELAKKEREKNGKAGTGGAGGPPGGMPGGPPSGGSGAPGAAPGASGASAANAPAAGAREGAATVAANTATPAAGSAPAAGTPSGAGNPANRQGNGAAGGQGTRPGQGGNFNGPRPGGAGGGAGAGGPGGQGGFNRQNMQNMTAEEREQMMARFSGMSGANGQRAGGANGQRAGAGATNGQRPGGANGQRMGGGFGGQRTGATGFNATTSAKAGPRPAQRRNGIVMVKKADGTLEARRVVYGVTNRVHAEVLEGLTEGEEVVVAKKEVESASASTPRPNNNNNNNNFQNNRGGGNNFSGGGNNFSGGGFPR